MRRPKTLFLVLMPFVLVTVAAAFGFNHKFQGQTKTGFPPGNWNFSAHPFMGEGYKSRPVVVTSVGSEVTALTVNVVGVRNISSKPVVGIKFGWFLTYDKDRTKILRKGETPLVAIKPALEPESVRGLKPTIVSFLEIHKSLTKKGRLDGNYRVDVAVIELLFSDRSTWQVGQEVSIFGSRGSFETVSFSGSPTLYVSPLVVPESCPKQKCKYVAVSPPHYTCEASDNDEFCTNCFTHCCVTMCGQVPQCDCS